MSQPISHIAFVGFSEAGQHFGRDLREQASLEITAYDLRFAGPNGGGLRDAATELGVGLTNSIAEAIAGADLIISAVTAEAATTVAEQTGRSIASDQFFLDIKLGFAWYQAIGGAVDFRSRRSLRRSRSYESDTSAWRICSHGNWRSACQCFGGAAPSTWLQPRCRQR